MRSRDAIDAVRNILKKVLRLGVSPSIPTDMTDGDVIVLADGLRWQAGGVVVKAADAGSLSAVAFSAARAERAARMFNTQTYT
jgi:hypothetical protein